MELSEVEVEAVKAHLKKRNKHIFTSTTIINFINILNELRVGKRTLEGWFVEGVVSNKEMILDLGLQKFINLEI